MGFVKIRLSQKLSLLSILFFVGITTIVLAQKRFERPALKKGNVEVPHERTIQWSEKSALADTILAAWANLNLQQGDEKVKNPRVLMAKLWIKKDLVEVNKTIINTKVRGISGSKWKMNPKGDYDFTETVLITILYLFGDKPEILFPETTQYLINTLLIDEGNKFRYYTIGTLRLVRETENHIMVVFENENPQELAKKLLDLNPISENLKTKIQLPNDSKIEYDVLAPKDKWVIKSVDGTALDRDFAKWALIDGVFK